MANRSLITQILRTSLFSLGGGACVLGIIFRLLPYYDVSGEMTMGISTNSRQIIFGVALLTILNIFKSYADILFFRIAMRIVGALFIAEVLFVLSLYYMPGVSLLGIGLLTLIIVGFRYTKHKFLQKILGLLVIVGALVVVFVQIPSYDLEVSSDLLIHHQPTIVEYNRSISVSGDIAGYGYLLYTTTSSPLEQRFDFDDENLLIPSTPTKVSRYAPDVLSGSLKITFWDGSVFALSPQTSVTITDNRSLSHPTPIRITLESGFGLYTSGSVSSGTHVFFPQKNVTGSVNNLLYIQTLQHTAQQLFAWKYTAMPYVEQVVWAKLKVLHRLSPKRFLSDQQSFLLYHFLLGKDLYGETLYPTPSNTWILTHMMYVPNDRLIGLQEPNNTDVGSEMIKTIRAGSHGLRYFQYFFGWFQ